MSALRSRCSLLVQESKRLRATVEWLVDNPEKRRAMLSDPAMKQYAAIDAYLVDPERGAAFLVVLKQMTEPPFISSCEEESEFRTPQQIKELRKREARAPADEPDADADVDLVAEASAPANKTVSPVIAAAKRYYTKRRTDRTKLGDLVSNFLKEATTHPSRDLAKGAPRLAVCGRTENPISYTQLNKCYNLLSKKEYSVLWTSTHDPVRIRSLMAERVLERQAAEAEAARKKDPAKRQAQRRLVRVCVCVWL